MENLVTNLVRWQPHQLATPSKYSTHLETNKHTLNLDLSKSKILFFWLDWPPFPLLKIIVKNTILNKKSAITSWYVQPKSTGKVRLRPSWFCSPSTLAIRMRISCEKGKKRTIVLKGGFIGDKNDANDEKDVNAHLPRCPSSHPLTSSSPSTSCSVDCHDQNNHDYKWWLSGWECTGAP